MLLSIGWLFTEGLFPPTRSSALTISQFQRRNRTGERPGYQESLISFNIQGRRFLPAAEAGGSLAEIWWKRERLSGVGADVVIPDFRDAAPLLELILGR